MISDLEALGSECMYNELAWLGSGMTVPEFMTFSMINNYVYFGILGTRYRNYMAYLYVSSQGVVIQYARCVM